jgi:hypothetical protein
MKLQGWAHQSNSSLATLSTRPLSSPCRQGAGTPPPVHVTVYDCTRDVEGAGSGDTRMHVGFLGREEADRALTEILDEVHFQQW